MAQRVAEQIHHAGSASRGYGTQHLKIYRIGMYEDPTTDRLMAMKSVDFAHFAALGTWSEGSVCKVCDAHTSDYIPPLLVQWERSTDVIGDFS